MTSQDDVNANSFPDAADEPDEPQDEASVFAPQSFDEADGGSATHAADADGEGESYGLPGLNDPAPPPARPAAQAPPAPLFPDDQPAHAPAAEQYQPDYQAPAEVQPDYDYAPEPASAHPAPAAPEQAEPEQAELETAETPQAQPPAPDRREADRRQGLPDPRGADAPDRRSSFRLGGTGFDQLPDHSRGLGGLNPTSPKVLAALAVILLILIVTYLTIAR